MYFLWRAPHALSCSPVRLAADRARFALALLSHAHAGIVVSGVGQRLLRQHDRRREDDISIVTCGLRVRLEASGGKWTVSDCCLAFGGMAATVVLAKQTAAALVGKEWSEEASTRRAAPFSRSCASHRRHLEVID